MILICWSAAGKVAAQNMYGRQKPYQGVPYFSSMLVRYSTHACCGNLWAV